MRLSLHAVEQYVSRHRPELRMPEATAELRALVADAVKERAAPSGGTIYRCPNGLRVVVKHDRGPLVVTVLPVDGRGVVVPDTTAEPEAPPDVEAALRDVHGYLRSRAGEGDRRARSILHAHAGVWR